MDDANKIHTSDGEPPQKPDKPDSKTVSLPYYSETKPDFPHPRGMTWARGAGKDGKTCWV